MLVDEGAFKRVLSMAGDGDTEGAVAVFRDHCLHRRRGQCDHPCLKFCGQCLAGTLLYASLKGRNRIYELTYDRLTIWCARRQAEIAKPASERCVIG